MECRFGAARLYAIHRLHGLALPSLGSLLLRNARLETTIEPFDRSDVQAGRNAPIPP